MTAQEIVSAPFTQTLVANIGQAQQTGLRISRFGGFGQIILNTIRGTSETNGTLIKAAVLYAYDLFIAPKTPGTEIDELAHQILSGLVDAIIKRLNLTPSTT